MKFLVTTSLCACAILASAQINIRDLKNKAQQKAANIVRQQVKDTRSALDSADFNYALAVSDNSGFANVQQSGETFIKAASYATQKDGQVTPAERCRNLLDWSQRLYNARYFRQAGRSLLITKAAYESEGLTSDVNYARALELLGLVGSTLGRLNEALTITQDALDKRKEIMGESSGGVAASLNNIADIYKNLGQYTEAEQAMGESLRLNEQVFGPQSLEVAIALNNQAMLLQKVGRFDEAEASLKRAFGILDAVKGAQAGYIIAFASNLALLYEHMGKYPEAEAIYLGMEKRLGRNSFNNAPLLNNQATLYIRMGKYDQVEPLLLRAGALYKTKFGEEHPSFAKVLNDLGNFYRIQGKSEPAVQTLQKALGIRERTLGTSHPAYVQSQEDLGIALWKSGKLEEAHPLMEASVGESMNFVNRYFPAMSESEKSKYWEVLNPRFQRFYNFALDASEAKPELLEDLFDYHAATKGLLLSSTNKVRQAILSGGDTRLINDYAAWTAQKELLARLYSYSKQELREQKINIDSLEDATNALEKSLSQRSADFSQSLSAEKVETSKIAALLGDTEALVDILRVRAYDRDFTDEARYIALVLTKGVTAPKPALLENGGQLETRYYKYYRNAVIQRINDEYSYDQFWARIDPLVKGKKTLYVSRDGVYNQVNLATMKKKDGDYLLNQYDLVYLGNSRDLPEIKSRKVVASKKSASLLGFPDFGGDKVPALPGSKTEIESLSKMLKTSGYTVDAQMQQSASEAKLKTVKGPLLLHIATHGYFLEDKDVKAGASVGIDMENAKENPLLRSGLLLAGASVTLSGEQSPDLKSNDNGVLTSYEAMNLSLDGTDLVVLSACETGLGEVKAGEGVYGLQRAFQAAGARSILMSLWKVDDAATQQLMTSFYTNWLKLGDKQKAFKQAQIQLMAKYKEPYFWGAFVMTGI
jgi:CHAT domain-containing protein/Flp pilus assembly protein TadD